MTTTNFQLPVESVSGTSFRDNLLTVLAAMSSNNQASVDPPVTYPGMLQVYTDSDSITQIRVRNVSNSGWVTLFPDLNKETGGLTSAVGDVAQAVYPVGTVYQNTSDARNPSIILGFGTWQSLAPGRVLIGVDPNDTDFDTVGNTGGEKSVGLTGANNGPHSHDVTDPGHIHPDSSAGGQTRVQSDSSSTYPYDSQAPKLPTSTATTGITIGSQGSGTPHNNLQPYYVTYRWVRTA